MKSIQKLAATAVLTLGVVAAPAAFAQQEGLVNVNVTDVSILNDLQLAAPINIQVPVGVAANVCGVQAAVLVADLQQDGVAECEAQNTSRAFSRLVARNQQ